MSSLDAIAPLTCTSCPRLAAFLDEHRRVHPDWHNAPVPSFGPREAQILIVGLAPGLKGANRTGRPFTGDFAGDTLYQTLLSTGLASGHYHTDGADDLTLPNVRITNAVRCVPPQNKPVGAEINACRPFLAARLASLPRLKIVLSLGKISHDGVRRAVNALGGEVKLKDAPFGHATAYEMDHKSGSFTLVSSYHCSRYNTNTGRLTEDMFSNVFADIRARLSK